MKRKGLEAFLSDIIPFNYRGKHGSYSPTSIFFEKKPNNNSDSNDFYIDFSFPYLESQPFAIMIDINASISKRVILIEFKSLLSIFLQKGFEVNTAFLHYYEGVWKSLITVGVQTGLCTQQELYLIRQIGDHVHNYKNKVPDVFLINAITCDAIDKTGRDEIEGIVGAKNTCQLSQLFLFSLSQTEFSYLFSRFFLARENQKIRRILKNRNIIV